MDLFTERRYFETKAQSILNKASPENFSTKYFKPTSYKSNLEFDSQSQKTRYFKIMKELQLIKGKCVSNPHNKIEIINSFIMLHTRYIPSPDETQKFLDFMSKGHVIPSTLNFKDALFYMLTYEKHFDMNEMDEYGFSYSRAGSKQRRNQSVLQTYKTQLQTRHQLQGDGQDRYVLVVF